MRCDKQVVRTDNVAFLREMVTKRAVVAIRQRLRWQDLERGPEKFDPFGKCPGLRFLRVVAKLGSNDDADADGLFADPGDVLGDRSLRMPNEVGDDIAIEQVAKRHRQSSTSSRGPKIIVHIRQNFVQRCQRSQQREQLTPADRLDDKADTLLAKNGFIPLQL